MATLTVIPMVEELAVSAQAGQSVYGDEEEVRPTQRAFGTARYPRAGSPASEAYPHRIRTSRRRRRI